MDLVHTYEHVHRYKIPNQAILYEIKKLQKRACAQSHRTTRSIEATMKANAKCIQRGKNLKTAEGSCNGEQYLVVYLGILTLARLIYREQRHFQTIP